MFFAVIFLFKIKVGWCSHSETKIRAKLLLRPVKQAREKDFYDKIVIYVDLHIQSVQ